MSRRKVIQTAGAAAAALAGIPTLPDPPRPRPKKEMVDFAAPKLEKVRVAFIGVGARGPGHIANFMKCDGVEIAGICDTHAPSRDAAVAQVVRAGRKAPPSFGDRGDYDYRRMLAGDFDAVVIATPWEWHVPMAIDAMKASKHAFVEVPASITVDGCWELVETAEATKRHCMMLENVNYGREELMVLNMCRLGVFGELLHGEAAYIHDLRGQMFEIEHGTGSWRTLHYTKRNGNLYPTHGLGPVAHYMDINRGDRFDYMSSMSCNSRVRALYAKEKFPEGHPRRKLKFVCGDLNTSIIRTLNGKTIMVQWDEQLPRPYSRHNFLQGTRGAWGGFPNRVVLEGQTPSTDDWTEGAALDAWFKKYDHPLWKKLSEAAVGGGHGGMDFVMAWRIVYCLRNGLPLDQDVYDAASWSVISPLSEASVANRGRVQDIPDFTRGAWKGRKPVTIEV